MKTRTVLFALCASWIFSCPAYAHRVGTPVTTIKWNERSGSWEIIHRMSAHDSEKVLASNTDIYSLDQQTLNDLVSKYVQEKFQILGLMSLNFVGAELEGSQVWAYYELSGLDQTVNLRSRLLLEADATSVSLVNVETSEGRKSIAFDTETGWQGVKLMRPENGR